MSLDITRNDLEDIGARLRRATSRAHQLTAQEVWGNIREKAPVDHGRLAGSFQLQAGSWQSRIFSNVKYAAVQEEGMDPRWIYPRNARVLAFDIGGQTMFARKVYHPGFPGKHYIADSIEDARNRIPDFVSSALAAEGLI